MINFAKSKLSLANNKQGNLRANLEILMPILLLGKIASC